MASKIRALREAKGYAQEIFAYEAGIERSYYGRHLSLFSSLSYYVAFMVLCRLDCRLEFIKEAVFAEKTALGEQTISTYFFIVIDIKIFSEKHLLLLRNIFFYLDRHLLS